MDTILVINAGSSSLKFQVYDARDRGNLKRLVKGQMDGVGARPHLRAEAADGTSLVDCTFEVEKIPDVAAAAHTVGNWLRETQEHLLVAVGHRVVHGGPQYGRPVLIDNTVLAKLERYIPLAPLHQPNNLAPIRSILARFPELPQVACFDTAFHRGHGVIADHFAIPEWLYVEGVRRYGFHGLSYEYIAERLRAFAPKIASGRVIVAHLGSGASMCALSNGCSIESTMGFTALDGLPMGTRPGQIDPGIVLYLIQQKGMPPAAVEELLYRGSGLRGMSAVSNDMRELEASSNPAAKLAIDHFVYRIGLHAGMLVAALGGLDAFVFTAGIGENSAMIRIRIAEKLRWLGVEIDSAANAAAGSTISAPNSEVALYVVPTDEELMIARHTVKLISERDLGTPPQEKIA
jgi:acetate kinase